MRQPRAVDIPPRSESSVVLALTSGLAGCSTGAFDVVGRSTSTFDVRDDPTGRVPMVEKTVLPLGLATDAGRALCLGLGRRCFFIAYSCSLTIVARRANCQGGLRHGSLCSRESLRLLTANYCGFLRSLIVFFRSSIN